MQWERPQHLFARRALTAQGWQQNVLITLKNGMIQKVDSGSTPPTHATSFDLLLPGMANVHSHAFQRAMAGLAEKGAGEGQDNFWTWREVMYGFAEKLTPEQIEIIARKFYIEILKQGYTSVGEFHYLHQDADGKPYSSITQLSDRVIAAAQDTGIHITHLPVLYETANFGSMPPAPRQRRFIHSIDAYLKLLEALQKKYAAAENFVLGVAPHSLRAVKAESLQTLLAALPDLKLDQSPIHMHVAEQEKEVADCLSWCGKRPMEWLLENAPVDSRWCLIHSTHLTPEETLNLAASDAVAGLCPSTEANLGDGIFPAEAYLKANGRFGIGSDSHISISPWEELRGLEYAQRLSLRRRAILQSKETLSVGRTLFEKAAEGGAQALSIPAGVIETGKRADLIALSLHEPLFEGKEGDALLDTLIFAVRADVTDVFVSGRRVVADGIHAGEEQAASDWRRVMRKLCD